MNEKWSARSETSRGTGGVPKRNLGTGKAGNAYRNWEGFALRTRSSRRERQGDF
jgi:hypothetical protein